MTAVIIQCRLNSSRLPGKAMIDLGGRPIVHWTMMAMKKVTADKYILATDEASAETLRPVAEQCGYEVVVGPLDDVLERFCIAIRQTGCDTVVRATADNPFLFYEAAQSLVEEYDRRECDYLTYTGLPHGSGVEVMRASALLRAGEGATAYDREHVGPALYNHTDKFNCVMLPAPTRFSRLSGLVSSEAYRTMRTTVDATADLRRARLVVRERLASLAVTVDSDSDRGDSFCHCSPSPSLPFTTEQILSALSAPAVSRPVLFAPSVAAGQGTGHLVRCAEAAAKMGAFILIDAPTLPPDTIRSIIDAAGLEPWQVVSDPPQPGDYALIVADRFALSADDAAAFARAAPLVSLDDGGEAADWADCLVDIIPSALDRAANITDPELMTRPEKVRSAPPVITGCFGQRPRNDGMGASFNEKSGTPVKLSDSEATPCKVLVCFGGEDPAGLTMPAAQAVQEALPGAEVTAIVPEGGGFDGFDTPRLHNSGGATQPPTFSAQGSGACSTENTQPPVNGNDGTPITVIPPVPNLRDTLADYDLVVTHYGLTAYEARAAGCAVLLVATTPLHGKLAAKYGFVCLGKGEVKAEKVRERLASLAVTVDSDSDRKNPSPSLSLPTLLRRASTGRRLPCPICGAKDDVALSPAPIIARASGRTYRRCPGCGMLYMSWTMDEPAKYDAEYFGEQYKKQYGRTYIEDFDAIKAQGARRVGVINKVASPSSRVRNDGRAAHSLLDRAGAREVFPASDSEATPALRRGTLLDVGCAYGPFLAAAHDAGWEVFGTDVSYAAVQYVHSVLLFPAAMARFPAFDAAAEFGTSQFDAVTMWFVIEHFSDLDSVLKRAASLVKPGGVFAFSTPSGQGVSAKSDRAGFFEKSPADHYTIWEPSRAASILKRYGFKVERIVSTGHHAERFDVVKWFDRWLVSKAEPLTNPDRGKGALLYKAVERASRMLGLGDTCEVYCKRLSPQ